MGRKYELERIKSATGANIVYGGRQLGKSALLKKAKDDINWDENGNRAVYVEIKGLNYQEAAMKIGHELYDQDILEDDIETTDWDELARAIKRRLQSGNKRIPYLLLLLDEADVFIESCEAVNYKPFDSLKEVQSIGPRRFKFVIAGLRNIVRFKREAALSNNSVLTSGSDDGEAFSLFRGPGTDGGSAALSGPALPEGEGIACNADPGHHKLFPRPDSNVLRKASGRNEKEGLCGIQ